MCDRAMMAERTVKGNIMKFCAFYDEHYREEMLRAGQIEQDMEKALTEHQYQMYLQPKYRLKDNSLCGAEVLCRWQHPEKGLIPPNDFIPLFEKNGFILKLDEYMWEEACKNIRWLDQGRSVVPISVNISRYHIQHNDLEKALMELIHKYDLTPDMLNLEITESLFLDKPEELNRVLDRLQKLGFKLEVDDFGSGFSSLNLIRNISVDTIKIDKEFLDSEIASEKGKIVVNHTIGMAKDLHLQVIAEGVLPPHAVVQPLQPVLTVGGVAVYQIKAGVFQRQHPPLVVVLFQPDAGGHCQRCRFAPAGCAGIALFLGRVGIFGVALRRKICLPRLHLGLLHREDVGIQRRKACGKIVGQAGPQAVDVPADQFHILFLSYA